MPVGTKETNLGLVMNGIHQILAYADVVNLRRNSKKKSRHATNKGKDTGLAVKRGKIKYIQDMIWK